jgi:hypothetical protein
MIAPPAPQSTIAVLGGMSLDGLGAMFNQMVNSTLPNGCADTCKVLGEDNGQCCIRFGAYKTGTMVVQSEGGLIKVLMPVQYRVAVGSNDIHPFSCGYGEPPLHGTAIATFALSADPTWHLNAVMVGDPRFELTEPCNVTGLNIPVSQFVARYTTERMRALAPGLMARVNAIQLGSLAAKGWAAINRPVRVADGAWLVLNPDRMGVSMLATDGDKAQVALGVEGRPEVVLSQSRPETKSGAQLPPAQQFPVSDGVSASFDLTLPWKELTNRLNDPKTGVVGMEIPLIGSHTIKVRHVDVVSTSEGMGLGVRFDGAANGRIFLTGIPTIRADADGTLYIQFQSLDYSLATANILVGAYSWLKHQSLVDRLRKVSTIRIDDRVAVLKARALRQLEKVDTLASGVTAAVSFDPAVAPQAVYTTTNALIARVSLSGHLRVIAKP